jgi:hypothetical protein
MAYIDNNDYANNETTESLGRSGDYRIRNKRAVRLLE